MSFPVSLFLAADLIEDEDQTILAESAVPTTSLQAAAAAVVPGHSCTSPVESSDTAAIIPTPDTSEKEEARKHAADHRRLLFAKESIYLRIRYTRGSVL